MRGFAADPDARVLEGACEHLVTPAPLGPIVDIAEQTNGPLAADIDAGASHAVSRWHAARRAARAPPPPLLVLEDLHWADEATLDCSLRLLRASIALPGAGDRRPSATTRLDRLHPLRTVLGDLATAPDRSSRLPRAAVAAGRGGARRPRVAPPPGSATDGNPFFVTEVLAAGDAGPGTVRDAVLAAAHASQRSRVPARGVALVPARAELWLLDALPSRAPDQLEECLASGMLVADRRRGAFRDELAASAVEDPSLRVVGASCTVALAHALVERRARRQPPRVAHHAAAVGDTAAILDTAVPRPCLARSRAHREAAAQYARVLEVERLAPQERADLLSAQSNEAQASGWSAW